MKQNRSFLFWILFCAAAFVSASSQFDFAGTIQQKLRLYYDRHIPVKIHITFNQPKYAAGDTAYYKISFFTADSYRPIGGRQIATVHLLNDQREVLHQSKVLLKDGVGVNQIPLPPNLPPGRYCIVAYNEAMKDADPSLVFQSPLWIAGPLRFQEVVLNDEIDFYPEGGHLIAGITNKIVVRGPANSAGKVFSDKGAEVTSLTLDQQGLGLFFLTPQENIRYSLSLQEENTKTELPLAEADGVSMLVTVPLNKLPIRVTVQVPPNSPMVSEELHLAMTSHGRVYSTASISFKDKSFLTFAFPQNNLPAGIACFSVLRSNGIILAERLIYIQDVSAPTVEISLSKDAFPVRDKIPFNIIVSGEDGKPRLSDLAITVYREDFTETEEGAAKTLYDNALLFGDLSGSLNISEDFSIGDPMGLSALDNYLITQKWKHYSWEDVWSEKLPSRAFRKYLHLQGRAFQTDNEPLPDSTVITFFLQKTVMVYEVFPDDSGRFDFSMLIDFYGEEEIFYRAESRGKFLPNVQVAPDSDIHFAGPVSTIKQTGVPDGFYTYNLQRNKIDKSYAFHLLDRTYEKPPSLNALIEEEVFGADIVVNMDDYLLFPTMSETLREVVPMLQHRKNKDRDIVRLFFDDRDRFFEEQPLFIIDGVITDNTTYFMNLKPAEVASIKIINSVEKLQTFGSIGKNGVVLVETRIAGNAERVPRSDYAFKAQGLSATRTFRGHPSHQVTRVPDLRTNLYWNPELRTDSTGRVSAIFNASDVTGTYRIKVEGFREDGQPLSVEKTFQVLFDAD